MASVTVKIESVEQEEEQLSAEEEYQVEADTSEEAEGNQTKGGMKEARTARRGLGRKKQSVGRRVTRATVAAAKTKRRGPRGDNSNPAALLDMLAEVASATLKNDRTIETRKRSPVGKSNKIALQKKAQPVAEELNLDQIRTLSDKLLLNMFAEQTADEIRRNYSYRCFLMPNKCQQRFTSFGNENKARVQMKNHLLGHIAQLLGDASAAGKSIKGKFVAESVTGRKRRMEAQQQSVERKTKVARGAMAAQEFDCRSQADAAESQRAFTRIQPLKKVKRTKALVSKKVGASFVQQFQLEEEGKAVLVEAEEPSEVNQQIVIEAVDEEWNPEEADEIQETECTLVETETINVCDQPHHDHCYTTMEGSKRQEYWDQESIVIHMDEEVVVVQAEEEQIDIQAEEPWTTPTTEEEEVAAAAAEKTVINNRDVGLQRAKQQEDNLWKLLEEEEQNSEMDTKCPKTEGPEWERMTALKCIRMMRMKKKDERVPLVCRICKDKRFTAQATLMYHYRSHAGIKPFVCSNCNATFTRQHSLNYHMLIHQNLSRFTCSDCGREFRHPSHFKEHMRRHTGETPFECSDCSIRFKTRNTYKRHLKTRHGKLLTVNGIVDLSVEEAARARTKPKRMLIHRDKVTQWPEITHSVGEGEEEMGDDEGGMAAALVAAADGAAEATEEVEQTAAARVLQVLSRTTPTSHHRIGELIISAYVINMEDGTTQIGLCPQPSFEMPIGELLLESADGNQTMEQVENEESILGLPNEGQEENSEEAEQQQEEEEEEDAAAAIEWIDASSIYGVEGDVGEGLCLHAVVPCT